VFSRVFHYVFSTVARPPPHWRHLLPAAAAECGGVAVRAAGGGGGRGGGPGGAGARGGVSGDRVAVAGWQWEERIGRVMGIILSGDKLRIGPVLTEL
jgi:hypothetical protein